MKNWNERLQHAIKLSDMNKGQFAKAVKVSPPTVTDWTKGVIKELKAENAAKIVEVLGIRMDWLLFGKGEMYIARTGLIDESALADQLKVYTLESAPVCEDEYLLQLDGGMLPGYSDAARFLCILFDEDAQENAKYVVLKKTEGEPAVICIQQGPKSSRTLLAELVGARRVDHPDYLHRYGEGEILCAIFDVVNDAGLWSE